MTQQIDRLSSEPSALELIHEEGIRRLGRDLADAQGLSLDEVRFMTTLYYQHQRDRIRANNQIKALERRAEPHRLLDLLQRQTAAFESDLERIMDRWTNGFPLGRWCRSFVGIGGILTAGLVSNIDITECSTVGRLWRFAGYDPTLRWLGVEKAKALLREVVPSGAPSPDEVLILAQRAGRRPDLFARQALDGDARRYTRESVEKALARRPWSARLKVLGYKLGESFVKVRRKPDDVFGKVYFERKVLEWSRNLSGEYAGTAQEEAKRARRADTVKRRWNEGHYAPGEAYRWQDYRAQDPATWPEDLGKGSGLPMLHPQHLNDRARRYAVKLFLSAYHEVAYFLHYGSMPPLPYVLSHLQHVDYRMAPHAELVPGLVEAQRAHLRGLPVRAAPWPVAVYDDEDEDGAGPLAAWGDDGDGES